MDTGFDFSRVQKIRFKTVYDAKKTAGTSFQSQTANLYHFDFHRVEWHWHPEFEILLIERGSLLARISGQEVLAGEGSALLLNSRQLHCFEANSSCLVHDFLYPGISLAPEDSPFYAHYIRPFIEEGPSFSLLDGSMDWHAEALPIIRLLFEDAQKSPGDEVRIISRLLKLHLFLQEQIEFPGPKTEKELRNETRLQMMLTFIQNNYEKMITLEDIAAAALTRRTTALSIFQDFLGLSPVAFLNRIRLLRAANLLAGTQMRITEIASACGFEGPSYLCRRFRTLYGMTPGDYRLMRAREAFEEGKDC